MYMYTLPVAFELHLMEKKEDEDKQNQNFHVWFSQPWEKLAEHMKYI